MLKICWILLCIENEQRPYINRTHDETYLSRKYVCFHNSIDFFGQAIFWAGFKEARTYIYIYACWLTLVMFLNLHCCGSIAQFWKLCISCLQILSWPKLAPFFLVEIELAITSWESKNCKGKGSRKGVVVRALEPGSNSGVDAICGWVVFGSLLCPKRFFFRYPDSPLPSRTEKNK